METLDAVRACYDQSVETEWNRLTRHYVEFEINKRFIDRYVQAGQNVLDIGGGPGRYALHLAEKAAV